jgi:hypothetical protein
MIFYKHTWVCSICGQGLTRKSTAKRHNNNLHSGAAMLVRPYEYIIGRLNGKFLGSDPSLYRRNNRSQKNMFDSIYHHQHGGNTRTGFGAVPSRIVHEQGYGSVGQQQPTQSNDFKETFYAQSHPPLRPYHKLDDIQAPDTVEKMERMVKLKEIEILANKHYPPQWATQIIILAGMQVNSGDDNSLDMNLAFLRNIDRGVSGSH